MLGQIMINSLMTLSSDLSPLSKGRQGRSSICLPVQLEGISNSFSRALTSSGSNAVPVSKQSFNLEIRESQDLAKDFGRTARSGKGYQAIEEFTLIVTPSWVIRARWREIRRFVLAFKARYFFLNSCITVKLSL